MLRHTHTDARAPANKHTHAKSKSNREKIIIFIHHATLHIYCLFCSHFFSSSTCVRLFCRCAHTEATKHWCCLQEYEETNLLNIIINEAFQELIFCTEKINLFILDHDVRSISERAKGQWGTYADGCTMERGFCFHIHTTIYSELGCLQRFDVFSVFRFVSFFFLLSSPLFICWPDANSLFAHCIKSCAVMKFQFHQPLILACARVARTTQRILNHKELDRADATHGPVVSLISLLLRPFFFLIDKIHTSRGTTQWLRQSRGSALS